jgi:polyhydroxybutyrate depolymerase
MSKWKKVLIGLLVVIALLVVGGYLYVQSMFPQEPELTGVYEKRSFSYDGVERSYSIYTPADLGDKPSLIFNLHGSGSDPDRSRSGMTFEFDLIAEEEGAIIVYAEGFENHWNDCRTALPYSATSINIDDVGFLVTLKNELLIAHGINPTRAFMMGMSNGGQMTYRMAMEAPDEFAAYAVLAASLPAEGNTKCIPSGKPVNILSVTGTADPINPFDGGEVTIFGEENSEGDVISASASARYFAELAGYRDDPASYDYPDNNPDDGTTASKLTWDGQAALVEHLILEGGGHAVPHPVTKYPPFFGPTNQDINGPREIWAFFQEVASK